jgi:hypothetical protein
MSRDPSKLRESIVAAAATATAGVLTAQNPIATAVNAIAAAAPSFLEYVRGLFQRDTEQRVAGLLVGATREGETPEEAARVIAEAGNDPATANTIVETMRRMTEALDPAVLPALGRLMRAYVDEGRAPDAFLRGSMRLLADLSADELEALRDLLSAIAGAINGQPFEIELVKLAAGGPGGRNALWITGIGTVRDDFPHARRLCRLLAANGFATSVDVDGENGIEAFVSELQPLQEIVEGPNDEETAAEPVKE